MAKLALEKVTGLFIYIDVVHSSLFIGISFIRSIGMQLIYDVV
jgi:hypothetical protein